MKEDIEMKVGILTYHDTKNFGSWLQAYALQKKCSDLGYDIEIIDYQCPEIVKRERPQPYPRSINPKEWLRDFLYVRPFRKTVRGMKSYTQKYFKMSKQYTPMTIQETNQLYDTFLVGSDIVWGTHINGKDWNYFLAFADDEKAKHSYASSVGEMWKPDEFEEVTHWLKRFDSIAVREQQSADWIKQVTSREASVVCDPTMLLSAEEWKEMISPRRIREKYILVYFMDSEGKIIEDAKKLGSRLGLPVYYAGLTNKMRGVHSYIISNPGDFLSVIANAEVVMCGSYHGTLFSLYFNKPFYYYYKHSASRLQFLSDIFHLESRFGPEADFENVYNIDYDLINKKIVELRMYGIQHLSQIKSGQSYSL